MTAITQPWHVEAGPYCEHYVKMRLSEASLYQTDNAAGGLSQDQSVTYRYREFFIFLVASEPVSEKSLGTGISQIWYR